MLNLLSDLNLDLNTSGKFNTHQRVYNLLRRLENVDQSLVSAILELLTAILVLVYCAEDRDDLLLSGKRDRTGNLCTVSGCNLNNLLCCGVNQYVIVALESNSDLLFNCHCSLPPYQISLVCGVPYI